MDRSWLATVCQRLDGGRAASGRRGLCCSPYGRMIWGRHCVLKTAPVQADRAENCFKTENPAHDRPDLHTKRQGATALCRPTWQAVLSCLPLSLLRSVCRMPETTPKKRRYDSMILRPGALEYALSRSGRKSTGSRAEKLRIGLLRECKRLRDFMTVFLFVGHDKTDS